MHELYEKLDQTPDTIEDMYQHMLNSLDKSYLSEAFRYFGLLIMSEERSLRPPNLLELAFTESEPWNRVPERNREYFTSPEFMHHCLRVETRILTRCAGLVEIQERPKQFLHGVEDYARSPEDGTLDDAEPRRILSGESVPANSDGQSPSRHLRSVEFIHRTVAEFLRNRHEALSHDPSECSAAAFALAQGKIGVMNLIPVLVPQSLLGRMVLTFFRVVEDIMNIVAFVQTTDQAFESAAIEMVDQVYQDIESIDVALNGPGVSWLERYQAQYDGSDHLRACPVASVKKLPFSDSSGFATLFGCQNHMHSTILRDFSREQMDYLLTCSLTGLKILDYGTPSYRTTAVFSIIRELLRRGAGSTSYIEPDGWADNMAPLSPWVAFLSFTARALRHTDASCVNEILKEIMTIFFSHGANANSRVLSAWINGITDSDRDAFIHIALEETPLSLVEDSLNSNGLDHLGVLDEILRSYGALSRRRFHLIRVWGIDEHKTEKFRHLRKEEWYRLSKRQSDRLCELRRQSYPKDQVFFANDSPMRPAFENYIRDLMRNLTESDLAETPIAITQSNWDEAGRLKTDEDISEEEIEEDGFAESDEDSFKNVEYQDHEDIGNEGTDSNR